MENVTLVREDVTKARLERAPFDAIVAADVLEHFADLDPLVRVIRVPKEPRRDAAYASGAWLRATGPYERAW